MSFYYWCEYTTESGIIMGRQMTPTTVSGGDLTTVSGHEWMSITEAEHDNIHDNGFDYYTVVSGELVVA
jgi:hypothetical protein